MSTRTESLTPSEFTVAELQRHVAEIDAELARLDREATRLSVAAVRDTDWNADAKLFALSGRVSALKAKREALIKQFPAAEARDRELAAHGDEVERARHMEAARQHAQEIVSLAQKIDAAVAEFKTLLRDITAAEAAARGSLRAAGASLGDAVAGREGLASKANLRMRLALEGGDNFVNSQPRDIASFASVGWAFLIEGGDDAGR
ncbi:hypothetical protein [Hyphomicrobium sp. CS1BSMeth3]|uniref:hypothetical protein n=1 Tax=Hyphomicrobium sp. CS1BSMeth3 TaxID=1892844 RepID=UPI0009312243|nr:hypothetical protein [Hyphomicrobium sp. CS1BSMeth3]